MPGYTYVFVDDIPQRCICPLCKLPMQKPIQIRNCKHSFCDSCLRNQFHHDNVQSIRLKCPLDENPFEFKDAQENAADQNIIETRMVKCPQEPYGCPWVDVVKHVTTHVKECRFVSEPCPQDCGLLINKANLDEHLKNSCTKNKQICAHCQRLFCQSAFQKHEGNCDEEVIWCENKCGQKIRRNRQERHLHYECHKREVKCSFCFKLFVYDTLQMHTQTCSLRSSTRYTGGLQSECTSSASSSLEKIKPNKTSDMNGHDVKCHGGSQMNNMSTSKTSSTKTENLSNPVYRRTRSIEDALDTSTIETFCPLKIFGCPFKGMRIHVDDHMKRETSNHISILCDVIRNQRREIDTLKRQLKNIPLVNNGKLIWRLDNYQEKLNQSKDYKDLEFCSVPFYTGRPGYRLQASVFLNGNGTAQGRYLSLYTKLLPGEFDPILTWPFISPVRLTLLDQSDGIKEHISESFVPDPTWKHFQRPTKDIAAFGFGYPRMISHETLHSKEYIKHDTLFLQVEVLSRDIV